MNPRKAIGSLVGFVILAGVSYHQVRDDGPDPRDTAIMSGAAVFARTTERTAPKKAADEHCENDVTGSATRNAEPCPDGHWR